LCAGVETIFKGDINLLERVQRNATKLVENVRYMTYKKRLHALGLTTLEVRRDRGDLIEVQKWWYGLSGLRFEIFFVLRQKKV
jgi:hypothetical protein